MCVAINLPSSLQPRLITTLAHLHGRTLPWEAAGSFHQVSLALDHPLLQRLSLAGHPARSGDTRQGSSLTAGLNKGRTALCSFTPVHLLCCKALTRVKDQAFPPALIKEGIFWDQPRAARGSFPHGKAFSTWTQSVLVENSHLYTAASQSTYTLGKNPKYFPPFIIPK